MLVKDANIWIRDKEYFIREATIREAVNMTKSISQLEKQNREAQTQSKWIESLGK